MYSADLGRELTPAEQNLFERAYTFPQKVVPLAAHMLEHDPGMVLVCDRNAHPIGQILEKVFATLEIEPPTADGMFHYRKVTSHVTTDVLGAHLLDFFGAVRNRDADHITVVDDHIHNGDTRRTFTRACRAARMSARITWMTVTGYGADFSSTPHVGPFPVMPWRDRTDLLGLDYSPDLTERYELPTTESRMLYAFMREGVKHAVARCSLRDMA